MKATECAECGKQYGELRNAKYCSKECTDKAANKRRAKNLKPRACSICSAFFAPAHGHQKMCSDACRQDHKLRVSRSKNRVAPKPAYPRDCASCGERYITTNKIKVYCSERCANKYRARQYERKRTKPHVFNCLLCGKESRAEKKGVKFCSCKCSRRYVAERDKIPDWLISERGFLKRLARNKQRLAKILKIRRRRDQILEKLTSPDRACHECGGVIIGQSNRAKYCSDSCAKKNARRKAKHRRKAKIKTLTVETVDPIAVFARDDWRCQICGVDTPQCLRGTIDDCAPELDHIYPLSRGGEHSYRNTQCLCRKCNAEKSDGLDFPGTKRGYKGGLAFAA